MILIFGGGIGCSIFMMVGMVVVIVLGWLGSMGLGSNIGKDIVFYLGEGIISIIKWFLFGNYVVWFNEYGIKIMCINFYFDSGGFEDVWKCVGYIDWL